MMLDDFEDEGIRTEIPAVEALRWRDRALSAEARRDELLAWLGVLVHDCPAGELRAAAARALAGQPAPAPGPSRARREAGR